MEIEIKLTIPLTIIKLKLISYSNMSINIIDSDEVLRMLVNSSKLKQERYIRVAIKIIDKVNNINYLSMFNLKSSSLSNIKDNILRNVKVYRDILILSRSIPEVQLHPVECIQLLRSGVESYLISYIHSQCSGSKSEKQIPLIIFEERILKLRLSEVYSRISYIHI